MSSLYHQICHQKWARIPDVRECMSRVVKWIAKIYEFSIKIQINNLQPTFSLWFLITYLEFNCISSILWIRLNNLKSFKRESKIKLVNWRIFQQIWKIAFSCSRSFLILEIFKLKHGSKIKWFTFRTQMKFLRKTLL